MNKTNARILPREPIICPWCGNVVNLRHGKIPQHTVKPGDKCIGSSVWYGEMTDEDREKVKARNRSA